MYEVRLSRRANSYYQRVDRDTARRLDRCIEDLKQNPFSSGNVRPLRGRSEMYRYRIGELRVIFTVTQRERVVTIISIGPRDDVY